MLTPSIRIRSFFLLALALAAHAAWPAQVTSSTVTSPQAEKLETVRDGPYLLESPQGTWRALTVEGKSGSTLSVGERSMQTGDEVTIGPVDWIPAFKVRLRKPDPVAPDEIRIAPGTPLFVVADTHGQFRIFVQLLQKHRVVDSSLKWSFAAGHLAILGDIFDRGPYHTEILWLLHKLQAEAAEAGGGVHLALGNHETLVLLGDDSDLHPKYREALRALQTHLRSSRSPMPYARLWDETTYLGRWLRSRASVIKLGDYLCLHGGISRDLVNRRLTLGQINAGIRNVLDHTTPVPGRNKGYLQLLDRKPNATDEERELARFLVSKPGPLWYRGYLWGDARPEDLKQAREHFDVKAVLVGHTEVPTITSLYGGQAIGVQVFPGYTVQGKPVGEALRIDNGRMLRALLDGTTQPLPRYSLSQALREAISVGGTQDAARAYEQWKKTGFAGFHVSEEALNRQGYVHLQQGKIAEALVFFEVGVERFPASWNAYDSLAEAYEKAGRRELAIANYRKSLALEPENGNAEKGLRRLQDT